MKRVQIAHIDRNPSNASERNLVALCAKHHDEYDTIPRQTKRLTPEEVTRFRDELYDILEKKRRSVTEACNLADLWTTMPRKGIVVSGRVYVNDDTELTEVLEHVRRQKAAGERAIDRLTRCLHDEHRLLWQQPKSDMSKT
ncbi:MAG: hypothetical protein JW818_20250 [Pirellulales bacterium]|nr:hypothetical protein [Pirellulales bacterium]